MNADPVLPIMIAVTVRNVYGRQLVYPANESAQLLARIAGTATLAPAVLKLAVQLGMTVTQVSDDASALAGIIA